MRVHNLSDKQLIDNITHYYTGALNAKQEYAGDWYRDAHAECKVIACHYGIPFETFVGVVAALSPQMNWKYNVREAVRMVNGKQPLGYGRNIAKARRILWDGEQPLDVLGGNKVRSFYANILSAGEDDKQVTIDTWALRIACDDVKYTGSITDKQYARIRKAYQHVADNFGILATELQAITWVHIRSLVNMRIGHTQLGLPL
jgi:hypothetical protein